MKQVYPIILTPEETGGYSVLVPDLQIGTQGETVAECMEMARDAIGLWGICEEDAGRTIPPASTLSPEHAPNEIVALADVDFQEYRRRNDMRTVRRNVSLPSWLNAAADEAGVNVSAILQSALKQALHLTDR